MLNTHVNIPEVSRLHGHRLAGPHMLLSLDRMLLKSTVTWLYPGGLRADRGLTLFQAWSTKEDHRRSCVSPGCFINTVCRSLRCDKEGLHQTTEWGVTSSKEKRRQRGTLSTTTHNMLPGSWWQRTSSVKNHKQPGVKSDLEEKVLCFLVFQRLRICLPAGVTVFLFLVQGDPTHR